MDKEEIFAKYFAILQEELIDAMGCTEPIALAYAASRGRDELGSIPEKVIARCSGNMLKNVRCVTIPNSGQLMGIEVAVLLGITGGNTAAEMEVLKDVTAEQRAQMRQLLAENRCQVEYLESPYPLHIILELQGKDHTVTIETKHTHLNVVRIEKDGRLTYENLESNPDSGNRTDRSDLSLEMIKTFADEFPLEKVKEMLDRQIQCNMDIAYEGMAGGYGVGLGRIIMANYADNVINRMKAYTAAASEARMGGCDMPVVTNSGSGNQGLATSVPLIVYAREMHLNNKKLYRALLFSNLVTIYQKEFIGRLSAFCGAVSACCAAGAGLTYLAGGTLEQITMTIDNTLANIPGIICDGAKISCAAKIATCLDAAIMAHYMALSGQAYSPHTGIIMEDIASTISSVGHIGRIGMKETDKEIINLLLK